jgi:AAA domain
MSALKLAAIFGRKVGVIDSEKGSASLYAGEPGIPEFGVIELENATISDYRRAIAEFAAEGYDVVIVDSLSHSWQAALEAVDRAGGWIKAGKTITPALQGLTSALLSYPGHVICTMRSKTEYAIDKDEKTGKTTMRKLGLAPQVRGDTEYEFTVVLDLDRSGTISVSKSRCGDALPMDQVYDRNTQLAKIGTAVKAWLGKGVALTPRSEALERVRFAHDQGALSKAAAWLNERAKAGELSAEDLAEIKAAFLAKKTEFAESADLGAIE